MVCISSQSDAAAADGLREMTALTSDSVIPSTSAVVAVGLVHVSTALLLPSAAPVAVRSEGAAGYTGNSLTLNDDSFRFLSLE